MHIAHYYGSLDPSLGGPPAVILGLSKGQLDLGCRVTLMSRDDRESAALAHLRDTGMAPYHRSVDLWERWGLGSLPGLRALDSVLRDADVLHIHGMWDPIALLAAQWATRYGRPYVVTPHGMLNKWSRRQKALKKGIALRLGFARMIRNAAVVHVLSAKERELTSGIPLPTNVVVIPNGITVEQFSDLPEPGTFRASHPELGDDPFVLFMGRLHPTKGLDILAAAFHAVLALLPNTRLVVIGPDHGARESFEKQLVELRIAGRTHILGPIYGRGKIEALRDAAVYCLPSRQEGFSVALLEAMACAVPCVITSACNFPEVAQASAGVVTAVDAAAVALALRAVLSDARSRAAMGERARTLVMQMYTWSRIAEMMDQAYRSILADWPSGARATRVHL